MVKGPFYVVNGTCVDVLSSERFDLNDQNFLPYKARYGVLILESHQQIRSVIGSTPLPADLLDTGNPFQNVLHEGFQSGIRVRMVDFLGYLPQKRENLIGQVSKLSRSVFLLVFLSSIKGG